MQQSTSVSKKTTFAWLWGILAVINVLPYIPPLLYRLGATHGASVLYSVLGFLCHQRPDRSFFLFGENIFYSKSEIFSTIPYNKIFTLQFDQRFTCSGQYGCKLGVCARCTGMYAGMLGGAVAAPFFPLSIKRSWIPYMLLIPLALDGIVQTIAFFISPEQGFYESTNPRRFVTGLLFGIGIGYILVSAITPTIAKNESAYYNKP